MLNHWLTIVLSEVAGAAGALTNRLATRREHRVMLTLGIECESYRTVCQAPSSLFISFVSTSDKVEVIDIVMVSFMT